MKAMKQIQKFQRLGTNDMKDKIVKDHKEIIIFLVDDDPLYLKLLEFQFRENSNLKIETFLTGEACLENLFSNPDVIILDYILSSENINALNGLQTLAIIKETLPNTEVIMLSGMEHIEVATNSLKLGAFDYVVKNLNTFSRLKAGIKNILQINSKEKELIVWDW